MMFPPWFRPVLIAASAAFLALGLQRVFLGIADGPDVVLVVIYGAALALLWGQHHA